jgi:hypothetical protein
MNARHERTVRVARAAGANAAARHARGEHVQAPNPLAGSLLARKAATAWHAGFAEAHEQKGTPMIGLETKVGPHGWEHGWHFVGVPGTGDSVHHPSHGKGVVTAVTDKHVAVRFSSGAERTFEHAPARPGQPAGFVKRGEGDAAAAGHDTRSVAGHAATARQLAVSLRGTPADIPVTRGTVSHPSASAALESAGRHFDNGDAEAARRDVGAAGAVMQAHAALLRTQAERHDAEAMATRGGAFSDEWKGRAYRARETADKLDTAVNGARGIMAATKPGSASGDSGKTAAAEHEFSPGYLRGEGATDADVAELSRRYEIMHGRKPTGAELAKIRRAKPTAQPTPTAAAEHADRAAMIAKAGDDNAHAMKRMMALAHAKRVHEADKAQGGGHLPPLALLGNEKHADGSMTASAVDHLGRDYTVKLGGDRSVTVTHEGQSLTAPGGANPTQTARELAGKLTTPAAPAATTADADKFWADEPAPAPPAPPAPKPKYEQGGMFAEPDKLGTAPMFGDQFGTSGITEPAPGLAAPAGRGTSAHGDTAAHLQGLDPRYRFSSALTRASGGPGSDDYGKMVNLVNGLKERPEDAVPRALAHAETGSPEALTRRAQQVEAVTGALNGMQHDAPAHQISAMNEYARQLRASVGAAGAGKTTGDPAHAAQIRQLAGRVDGDSALERRTRSHLEDAATAVEKGNRSDAYGHLDAARHVASGANTASHPESHLVTDTDGHGVVPAIEGHMRRVPYAPADTADIGRVGLLGALARDTERLSGASRAHSDEGAAHLATAAAHMRAGRDAEASASLRDATGALERDSVAAGGARDGQRAAGNAAKAAGLRDEASAILSRHTGSADPAKRVGQEASAAHAATARGIAADVRMERGLTAGQREDAETSLHAAARHLEAGNHAEAAHELDNAMHATSMRGGGIIKGSVAARSRDLANQVRTGRDGIPRPGAGQGGGPDTPWHGSLAAGDAVESRSLNGRLLALSHPAGRPYQAHVDGTFIGQHEDLGKLRRTLERRAAKAQPGDEKALSAALEVKDLGTAIVSRSGREPDVRRQLACATAALEGGDPQTAYGALDLARRYAVGELGGNPATAHLQVMLADGTEASKAIIRWRDAVRQG